MMCWLCESESNELCPARKVFSARNVVVEEHDWCERQCENCLCHGAAEFSYFSGCRCRWLRSIHLPLHVKIVDPLYCTALAVAGLVAWSDHCFKNRCSRIADRVSMWFHLWASVMLLLCDRLCIGKQDLLDCMCMVCTFICFIYDVVTDHRSSTTDFLYVAIPISSVLLLTTCLISVPFNPFVVATL